MSVANVQCRWVNGNQYFYDKSGNVIYYIDGTNGKAVFTALDRSSLTEEPLAAAVPITLLKVDGATLVAAESAGTFNIAIGTNTLLIQGEVCDNETETSVGYAMVTLPENYVAAGDVTVRLRSALIKTAAATNNGSTLDVEAFEQADGAVGADICATAAATFAADDTWYNKDFVITPTGLVAGDKLLLKITSTVIDSEAGGGTLRLNIERPVLLCDVKG